MSSSRRGVARPLGRRDLEVIETAIVAGRSEYDVMDSFRRMSGRELPDLGVSRKELAIRGLEALVAIWEQQLREQEDHLAWLESTDGRRVYRKEDSREMARETRDRYLRRLDRYIRLLGRVRVHGVPDEPASEPAGESANERAGKPASDAEEGSPVIGASS
jgi:hypothetical protein